MNPYETTFRDRLVKQGWTVLSYGWPDFAVLDDDGSLNCLVELKSDGDRLRPHQLAIHDALRRAGVRVVLLSGERETREFLGQLEGIRRWRDPAVRARAELVRRLPTFTWDHEPVVNAS